MINQNGGDGYFNRLHSYFKLQFKERILKMISIRKSVFFIKTEKNAYVVKGYTKSKKLKLQETFTAALREEGFTKSYVFVRHPLKESLFFEGEYFGCMEYLHPNQQAFSFHSFKNRLEGLGLLDEFHQVTSSFAEKYQSLIPDNDLQDKWDERLRTFRHNNSLLRYFLDEKLIYELVEWARWSLSGIKENEVMLYKNHNVILHGDVAHHNFLRDKTGRLNLIDFDLISIGPEWIDTLQYANRILPYMDWNFDQLSKYPQIKKLLTEKAFLYALAYPTDIFREWNRILREKTYKKRSVSKQVMNLTLEKFSLRKQFVKKISAVIQRHGDF